jgi:hypothetical protein
MIDTPDPHEEALELLKLIADVRTPYGDLKPSFREPHCLRWPNRLKESRPNCAVPRSQHGSFSIN